MHRILVQGLVSLLKEDYTRSCVAFRAISTGTAIHRGIKRSRAGRFHERRARLEQAYEHERRSSRNNVPERFQGSREQQGTGTGNLSYSRQNSRNRFTSEQGQPWQRQQASRYEAPQQRFREASIRPRYHEEHNVNDRQQNARYGEYRSSSHASSAPDRRHQVDRLPSRRSAGDRHQPSELHSGKYEELGDYAKPSFRPSGQPLDRDGLASPRQSLHRTYQSSSSHESKYTTPDVQDRPVRKSTAPLSLPYTTPASEFLYGKSVIMAALQSERRKLYKLYMYDGETQEIQDQDQSVRKFALARGCIVVKLKRDALPLMDKMSAGRPHNGYILEASPLPKMPIKGFERVASPNGVFEMILDHQSREEEAINGTDPKVKYKMGSPRYPFVLLLDGIRDLGNFGAVMRTAFYFGVDAVVIPTHNSAPLNPVTLKASAGASEIINMFSVSQPGAFIDSSRRNGWKFYAGTSPAGNTPMNFKRPPYFPLSDLRCPTQNHPCVLMLGSEGEGLPHFLHRKADLELGVEGERAGEGGVDSLNVSVAAGLLCEAFTRKPTSDDAKRDQYFRKSDKGGLSANYVQVPDLASDKLSVNSENQLF